MLQTKGKIFQVEPTEEDPGTPSGPQDGPPGRPQPNGAQPGQFDAFHNYLDTVIGDTQWAKKGNDRKYGWVAQSGPHKGKTMDEIRIIEQKRFAAFPAAKKDSFATPAHAWVPGQGNQAGAPGQAGGGTVAGAPVTGRQEFTARWATQFPGLDKRAEMSATPRGEFTAGWANQFPGLDRRDGMNEGRPRPNPAPSWEEFRQQQEAARKQQWQGKAQAEQKTLADRGDAMGKAIDQMPTGQKNWAEKALNSATPVSPARDAPNPSAVQPNSATTPDGASTAMSGEVSMDDITKRIEAGAQPAIDAIKKDYEDIKKMRARIYDDTSMTSSVNRGAQGRVVQDMARKAAEWEANNKGSERPNPWNKQIERYSTIAAFGRPVQGEEPVVVMPEPATIGDYYTGSGMHKAAAVRANLIEGRMDDAGVRTAKEANEFMQGLKKRDSELVKGVYISQANTPGAPMKPISPYGKRTATGTKIKSQVR